MAEEIEWEIPEQAQPKPDEVAFDLDEALLSIVGIQATIPEDGFTAPTLGTQRGGSGVVIRESGLIVTIGYLITEAETIWITTSDGRATQGHVAAYDQETGFGLVQALGRLGMPALPLGRSGAVLIGSLSPDEGAFALTVTASTPRPIRLSFAELPPRGALRDKLEAEIPLKLYYNDVHGAPAWRRQVTLQFAEEIRAELAGNGAGAA